MAVVNPEHLAICASPEWAQLLQDELLPWVLEGQELGDALLEVGPGPGLTTDILRRLAARVTAVELDADLARQLGSRLVATNVTVIRADAARLPLRPDSFSAALCLTMLHHVPSQALQDAVFAEIRRVLRPGGVLAGSDGLDTPGRREVHHGDVFVPVDPGTLPARLQAAGFTRPRVDVRGDRVRFTATA
jgi:SAM-dependent methyltransferase